jgi:uncharacterized protein YqeY
MNIIRIGYDDKVARKIAEVAQNKLNKLKLITMNLKEQILKDKNQAMIERNSEKKLVLSTLIGELDRISKNPSNDEIIRIIQKMVTNNVITKNENENKHLKIYLPKMLSEIELINIVTEQMKENNLEGMRAMGPVMNYLKQNYSGQFDGKKVSEIIKTMI